MLPLRECLSALPSLHTLEIVDSSHAATGMVKAAFKHKPDFPNIKRVTIPLTAHPILSRLPNVEEIVCLRGTMRVNVRPLLSSLRGPYVRERNGEVEPVLKSFTVISISPEMGFTEGM
jgi:hypothetical protein